MHTLPNLLLASLFLFVAQLTQASENTVPQLPSWQVLEYEQKAFWATASSKLEILPVAGKPDVWMLTVLSSVVDNSEKLQESFDPATGGVISRSRVSSGKEQRMKTYQYESDYILRERRNSPADANTPPAQWPVSNTRYVKYPASKGETVISSPYLLLVLASQLQAQGSDQSREVIVHTDVNFYRVKLTTGYGIPVKAKYQVTGGAAVSGTVDTTAVAIQASPEGALEDGDDFSVLGLQGEVILFFDPKSGLPLQIRGTAPRIGATEINLKSATLRTAP